MLERKGDYIHATIHDFKANISGLLALLQNPKSGVKGVLLKNRNKVVAVVAPLLSNKAMGGSIGSSLDSFDNIKGG